VTNIPGVPITRGKISNVAITKVDSNAVIARGKMMEYDLSFLPKNSLAEGSYIMITFSYNVVELFTAPNYYIISGVDDYSESSPVGLLATVNSFKITNFRPISIPQMISLRMRLNNPTALFSVTIATFDANGNAIDYDASASVTVSPISKEYILSL